MRPSAMVPAPGVEPEPVSTTTFCAIIPRAPYPPQPLPYHEWLPYEAEEMLSGPPTTFNPAAEAMS